MFVFYFAVSKSVTKVLNSNGSYRCWLGCLSVILIIDEKATGKKKRFRFIAFHTLVGSPHSTHLLIFQFLFIFKHVLLLRQIYHQENWYKFYADGNESGLLPWTRWCQNRSQSRGFRTESRTLHRSGDLNFFEFCLSGSKQISDQNLDCQGPQVRLVSYEHVSID